MITRNQIYKRTVQFRALMQELLELDSLRNKVRNAEMGPTRVGSLPGAVDGKMKIPFCGLGPCHR